MTVEIRKLRLDEAALLDHVAEDVFDDSIVPERAREFLADPRHHLVVAIEQNRIVGFVSAVHYLHPDKAQPELWINEVGVAPELQGRGVGRALMEATLALGRELQCSVAWVLTERTNTAAMALYARTGAEEAEEEAVMFTYHL